MKCAVKKKSIKYYFHYFMIHIECLKIKSVVSTMIFLMWLKEKGV